MTTEPQIIDHFVINGKAYTVKGHKNGVPIIDFKMGSDYDWQLMCLKSRLEHPEYYAGEEDFNEKTARLRKWLEEHKPQEVIA